MRIFNLSLINFRNYEKLSIKFNDNINIFIGNNGEGKTNILESIYVLAITKSHRSYIDKNLITNNKNILKEKMQHGQVHERRYPAYRQRRRCGIHPHAVHRYFRHHEECGNHQFPD